MKTRGMRLKWLMASVVAAAPGLGWVTNAARTQERAVGAIRRASGFVRYDWDEFDREFGEVITPGRPWAPAWLVDRLGPDFFGSVRLVNFSLRSADPSADREAYRALGSLSRLRELSVFGPTFGDEQMPPLGSMRDLRRLWLEATRVSDRGAAHLAGLDRLELLDLSRTRITGATIATVATLPALERLSCRDLPITLADLAPLRHHPRLKVLDLRGVPHLDPKGLAEFARTLPNLDAVLVWHDPEGGQPTPGDPRIVPCFYQICD